jgi:hypothetical protein
VYDFHFNQDFFTAVLEERNASKVFNFIIILDIYISKPFDLFNFKYGENVLILLLCEGLQ